MKSVLIIEDETQTRNIFLRCLDFEGFHSIGAENGIEGIKLAQSHRPDLIVCDIMMPDIDGYEVLSTLRDAKPTASIPLIFLTAKVTMADLRRGMELGADDYLTKPCTIEQFLAAINTRLKRWEQVERLYSSPSSDHSRDNQKPDKRGSKEQKQVSLFPDYPHLRSVFSFIEAHYRQPINLNDVAQEAGYSPAYLTNLVQEQTGRTIKQWIIERRMAQARNLLVHTTQTVRQVAEASGYSDAGYFTRQFRQLHGRSPQVWRRESVTKITN